MSTSRVKVLHLVADSLQGGAGRGAYWLHKGLIEIGVDSILVTTGKETFDDPTVISITTSSLDKAKSILINKINKIWVKAYTKRESKIFNTGLLGRNLKKFIRSAEVDIVHLHWINGLVSTKTIGEIDKPVVWTLRDMWPFTGGCHYALDCYRFYTGCGKCPQLGSTRNLDLSRLVIRSKLNNYPSRLQPVGISDWLTRQASNSLVFSKLNPVTIPNNIDTSIFRPMDKRIARDILGINTQKKIILIGATNLSDFYKGFSKALGALDYLDKDKYALCVFGKVSTQVLVETGFEFYKLGFLNDNLSLRIAYCASDVFLAPSVMEAFGKTIAESLSCGTPAVCFDATGPQSIVEHKIDGYRAIPFDVRDIAKGINWVINESDYIQLQRIARMNAVNKFDSKVIAKKYSKLYLNVIFGKKLDF